jgi:hypothetical protein
MPTPARQAFDSDVIRALDAAGIAKDAPAHDATIAPVAAARALASLVAGASLALRGTPPLEGGDEAWAPAPVDPVWIRVERGAAEVTVVALRGAAAAKRAATRIAVEAEAHACCDAPSCKLERTLARVWLELGGEGPARVCVGEWSDAAAGKAALHASRVARALGDVLGVPVEGAGDAPTDAPEPESAPLSALALARFGLRCEGGRFVVRDYASIGPREGAGMDTGVGVALLLVAAGLLAGAARSWLAGSSDAALGLAALAALVTFFGVTYVSVGRHSASFRGTSSPRVVTYAGRLICGPWESHEGAVGKKPEGHFGAAVPLPDVTGFRLLPRDGTSVAVIDTDHGPFDGVIADDEAQARYWLAAIERAVTAASHPEPRETSRKRARERARAETVAATT